MMDTDVFVNIYYYQYQGVGKNHSKDWENQHFYGLELLKQGLKQEFNIDYSEKIIGKGKYGKPFLINKEGFFNISHCNGLVACALSNIPVGIDVECPRKFQEGILNKICNEEEKAYILKQDEIKRFLQIWTLKESYIKMRGEGLRYPLKDVNFTITPWKKNEGSGWKGPEEIRCNREGYFYQKMAAGHVVSISVGKMIMEPILHSGESIHFNRMDA